MFEGLGAGGALERQGSGLHAYRNRIWNVNGQTYEITMRFLTLKGSLLALIPSEPYRDH